MTFVICEKRRTVLDAEGHVLVTGGPGSGKTTIALAKAVKRIEAGLKLGQMVLFLSFSRAAVARIAESSKTQVPRESQGLLVIQTFHSLFWEILRTHGYLLGSPRRLGLLLPYDERAKRAGLEERDPVWIEERERLFREEGRVAFDLFAVKAAALLGGSAVIRRLVADRYPLVIVDEAQDTAEDQWLCVKTLASLSQLVCLADLDQQIYDFRPGVTAERLTHIVQSLSPVVVDLGSENNRSPGGEILQFGNDILLGTPRGAPYMGVSRLGLPRKVKDRDRWIRQSVGLISRKILDSTGSRPESVAFLASWSKGVTVISRALRGTSPEQEIVHQVHFDETEVYLASRIIAFCMEPKKHEAEREDLATLLDLLAAVFRARGSATALKEGDKIANWAKLARDGGAPQYPVVKQVTAILHRLVSYRFSGDPRQDWLFVRNLFRSVKAKVLRGVVNEVEYLMAFSRGRRISAGLLASWQKDGCYSDARGALDSALAEDQLISGITDLRGLNVMTIHRAKGKEFDGVIIFNEANISPLASVHEVAPYPKSRRLLRVGITRAKHHVLLLCDAISPCPLLSGHNL
jgi:DNA helicase-2/ATP-dependent DNA helicase PcrA